MRVISIVDETILTKLIHGCDVYCDVSAYALLYGQFPCLQSVASLMSNENRVIVELEVPEGEILQMRGLSTGEVYVNNYGMMLHKEYFMCARKTFVVQLPYIRSEWIVCSKVRTDRTLSYSTWNSRIYNKCKVPLWSGSVAVDNDGRLYDVCAAKVVRDFDKYMCEEFNLDWLVIQALQALQLREGALLCNKRLGVSSIKEAYALLKDSDKIYLRDWEAS